MEKRKFVSFIDKYYLAGSTNSVKLQCKDQALGCQFITEDQNVVGNVTMKGFDMPDCELGVYTTAQLTKMLTALGNDVTVQVNKADQTAFSIQLADTSTIITYMLADLSVIQQAPNMKQLPEFNVAIDLSKDLADKFVKSKNALPDAENFAVKSDGMGTEMILNYSSLNTNRISFDVTVKDPGDLNAVCFSANLLKEILVANKDADSGTLEVSQQGLARATFKSGDFEATYYLVQLQAA